MNVPLNAGGLDSLSYMFKLGSRCTARCFFRLQFFVKPFPHLIQTKGFSPVCVRWCISRVHFWIKPFPQRGQRYGFSPVCVRWCVYRCPFCAYLFPQSVHLNGFSPVWLLWCISSWLKHLKLLPHCKQPNLLAAEFLKLWSFMFLSALKLWEPTFGAKLFPASRVVWAGGPCGFNWISLLPGPVRGDWVLKITKLSGKRGCWCSATGLGHCITSGLLQVSVTASRPVDKDTSKLNIYINHKNCSLAKHSCDTHCVHLSHVVQCQHCPTLPALPLQLLIQAALLGDLPSIVGGGVCKWY